jgi:hypothetical protein
MKNYSRQIQDAVAKYEADMEKLREQHAQDKATVRRWFRLWMSSILAILVVGTTISFITKAKGY